MTHKKHPEPPKAAGGVGALVASARALVDQRATNLGSFLKVNRPGGFDCPGCAWPEPEQPSRLEFCENGFKAIAHEITRKKVDRHFFDRHSVSKLKGWSGFLLERQGRLVEPLRYNRQTDRYEPISWQAAFDLIGQTLLGLESPDRAVFYTSGRTSNEAAFLYQLFGRQLGTNNFPDCSNMCHESSGVALTEAIGIGKGTVTLADFEKADAILIFGQNPGTNHPRMLAELEKAAKRGCRIVSFNPLKEAGLIGFIHPKNAGAMLLNRPTALSDTYLQPLVGGDLAAIKGLAKCLLEMEAARPGEALDRDFIAEHTSGYEDFARDIAATSWEAIETGSGLSRQALREVAEIYAGAKAVIACWAMGLTQQKQAVGTIQMLMNLLLMGGNIGRPGAGACPVRGHSNVQGDRTVGIVEKPGEAFLESLGRVFQFDPPRHHGYHTVSAIQAMAEGKVDALVSMGGNFAAATPDRDFTEGALGRLKLTVHVSTKLNRSHLITGKDALILPCLGRTERDLQASGPQVVTVEDSMSMVHASKGHKSPAGPDLRSEPAIVAGMAAASLPESRIDWAALVADYDRIRDKMEAVMPMFRDYNRRIRRPGGFYLGNSARERDWKTATGKARFMVHPLPAESTREGEVRLMTIRSHDQYNTTVYGLNDRYRGIKGKRRVVFLNPEDLRRRNISEGARVDLIHDAEDGIQRKAEKFEAIAYDIPRGCAAAYFPETNVLVPIGSYADRSFTPTSKLIPIRVVPSTV